MNTGDTMFATGFVILGHQLLFQGMFAAKNIVLRRKIGKPIRGKNREVLTAIAFFVLFIVIALVVSFSGVPVLRVRILPDGFALVAGLGLLLVNLAVSGASLLHLKDSWRVGVIEDQQTELIATGIYRFTRNPYFVTYLLMFAAYTVMLQSLLLLGLSIVGFIFVHRMILKEEDYLYSVHGKAYLDYKKSVPRYLLR